MMDSINLLVMGRRPTWSVDEWIRLGTIFCEWECCSQLSKMKAADHLRKTRKRVKKEERIGRSTVVEDYRAKAILTGYRKGVKFD